MSRCFVILLLLAAEAFAGSLWLKSEAMVPVQVTLKEGRLLTQNHQKSRIKEEIRRQLKFTVGQLNFQGAGPALELTLDIRILSLSRVADNLFEAKYQARFLMGWDKFTPLPLGQEMYFPQQSSEAAIKLFHSRYVENCGLAFEEGPETFFFYFRPHFDECPIISAPAPEMVFRFQLEFKLLKIEAPVTAPEYQRVWRDGKLTATLYFSETEDDFPSGGQTFQDLLVERYGQPFYKVVTKAEGQFLITRSIYNTEKGVLDVSVFDLLKGNITTAPWDFMADLNRRIAYSDFVSYNGHSGYGKKLKKFIDLSGFQHGVYKLVHLNGCDTFTYVQPSLLQHRSKIDVVTTGLSAYFSFMSPYTFEIMNALMDQKDDYSELFQRISVGAPLLLGRFTCGIGSGRGCLLPR